MMNKVTNLLSGIGLAIAAVSIPAAADVKVGVVDVIQLILDRQLQDSHHTLCHHVGTRTQACCLVCIVSVQAFRKMATAFR